MPNGDPPKTSLAKKEQEIEFVPFGTADKIRLSLAIIRTYIAEPAQGGALPDDRQCMHFMMMCKARQLNPFEGDAFMVPFYDKAKQAYRWSLITAHNVFLKRAEVHPDYAGKKSGVIITPQRCKGCGGDGVIRITENGLIKDIRRC